MLYLDESDVRDLLPMSEAIPLMRSAFETLAAGGAVNHPRRRLVLPAGSTLHYMAASDGGFFGAKLYATHPRHGAHFLLLLYAAADARPLAILEANWLGQIRTGAVSGLATQFMARADAGRLAIIGSGFQAASQLEAMRLVRPIRQTRVWSRSPEKREAFARRYGVEAADTAEQAVRDADIIVTATNAKEPVIDLAWLAPGAHLNAMGSNQATRRELPASIIHAASRIAVDSLEQARMESGDLLMALGNTDWTQPKVLELKDIVSGRVPGRTGPQELTIFKSNGLAVEDVAAAGCVYRKAVEAGRGRAYS